MSKQVTVGELKDRCNKAELFLTSIYMSCLTAKFLYEEGSEAYQFAVAILDNSDERYPNQEFYNDNVSEDAPSLEVAAKVALIELLEVRLREKGEEQ